MEILVKRSAFSAAVGADADARLTYESNHGKWQALVAITSLTGKTYFANGFAFLQSDKGHNAIARLREWEFTLRRRF